jgi:hypothetical protein
MDIVPYGLMNLVLCSEFLRFAILILDLNLEACSCPWLAQGVIHFVPEPLVSFPLYD